MLSVLTALSFSHLLNDAMQSLIPAIYPILKSALHLDFVHIGLITLANQLTASVLQPFVGLYTDRRPQPFSLAVGMSFTLAGLVLLSFAGSLALVLLPSPSLASGRPCFTRKLLALRFPLGGDDSALPNRSFRSAATPGAHLAPCSRL